MRNQTTQTDGVHCYEFLAGAYPGSSLAPVPRFGMYPHIRRWRAAFWHNFVHSGLLACVQALLAQQCFSVFLSSSLCNDQVVGWH